MDERNPDLQRVDELIDEARDAAAREGAVDDGEQKWHESGTIHPELDDQTIAPPG